MEIKMPEDDASKNLVGSLNSINRVIAVMSGKGGVGKSTVTALVASTLAKSGFKVGILDADITGPSQPRAFGLKHVNLTGTDFGITPALTRSGIKMISTNFMLKEEDDPVIWRGPLLAGAVKQFWEEVDWQELDYLVVDLPPGTGDVPLTVLQTLPVSGLVIVSSPQDLAYMIVKKAVKMANQIKTPILGLIENMNELICPECNGRLKIFGESQGESLAAKMGIELLGSMPWDVNLNKLVDQGKVEDYYSAEIAAIVEKIVAKTE
ncbi:MAG: Mrp/NBP35 family ATP-binding protein [Syntrophomonadaceae bacterium]|nr:Mrp/NBP35 family ATP-binding protein [Syntrophomonadaceae bacterium]